MPGVFSRTRFGPSAKLAEENSACTSGVADSGKTFTEADSKEAA